MALNTRILGIDPGSCITGYGVIEMREGKAAYVASGCIRTQSIDLPGRIAEIYRGLQTLIGELNPAQAAIESVFMHRNAASALKLGQARGAAICAVVCSEVAISEYAPAQIKQAVVGRGNATKEQVQHMIQALLELDRCPQADAADALAVALCHTHTRQTPVGVAVRRHRGRWR